MAYRVNLEKSTVDNNYYRKVLFTTKQLQLVLMSLEQDEEIPEEIHKHTTQFIRIEQGVASVYVGNKRYLLKDGDSITIPPNKKHYIKNNNDQVLKLYTIYSPPEHSKKLKEK